MSGELCPEEFHSLQRVHGNVGSRLSVPSVRLSTVGSRAFPVAGPRIWNALPKETTSAQSLSLFRQRLMSHLSGDGIQTSTLMFLLSDCFC